jgi:hypothetical protein
MTLENVLRGEARMVEARMVIRSSCMGAGEGHALHDMDLGRLCYLTQVVEGRHIGIEIKDGGLRWEEVELQRCLNR